MAKGKRNFGDSPQDILLKRQLGADEYDRRKAKLQGEIELKKSSKAVKEAFTGGVNTAIDDGWIKARGRYFWTTNGIVVDSTNPFFQEYSATYTDEDGSSQTEKNAETTESWADKWASENGL